jgi:hypothetical protein
LAFAVSQSSNRAVPLGYSLPTLTKNVPVPFRYLDSFLEIVTGPPTKIPWQQAFPEWSSHVMEALST